MKHRYFYVDLDMSQVKALPSPEGKTTLSRVLLYSNYREVSLAKGQWCCLLAGSMASLAVVLSFSFTLPHLICAATSWPLYKE